MDSAINANIFFFVTTIAVVIFTILGIILAVYLIRIMFDVKKFTDILKEKAEDVGKDITSIRKKMKESTLFGWIFPQKRNKKK